MAAACCLCYEMGFQVGTFMCKFYNFFEEFSMTVSVLLLVLIAAERYVAIIHPLQARSLFTRFRMYAALVSTTCGRLVGQLQFSPPTTTFLRLLNVFLFITSIIFCSEIEDVATLKVLYLGVRGHQSFPSFLILCFYLPPV